jgi:phage-related protein
MASMSTVLTNFRNFGDSATYTYGSHTASEPRLVIQRRVVPQGNQIVAESTLQVVSSTEDADGELLASRVLFEAKARTPITGIEADVDAALVVFRDIVASDEFTNFVKTQEWAA